MTDPVSSPSVGQTRRRTSRLAAILDALAGVGEVDVADLSSSLGVSASTLRRDLARLEDQGLLTRTHGGATSTRAAVGGELPVRYRDGRWDDEKLAIATAVGASVPPGRLVVGLTGGTTTSAVARVLAHRTDLTIVTNAVNIAADLAIRSGARVFLTGGFVRTQSYEVVGPSAMQALARLTLNYAFVGVDGISAAAGLTTHDEVEAHTDLAMIRRARRVVVVADGRKVGREMLAQIAPVTEAHELVTTPSADPEVLAQLREAGMVVTVVAPRRRGTPPR